MLICAHGFLPGVRLQCASIVRTERLQEAFLSCVSRKLFAKVNGDVQNSILACYLLRDIFLNLSISHTLLCTVSENAMR